MIYTVYTVCAVCMVYIVYTVYTVYTVYIAKCAVCCKFIAKCAVCCGLLQTCYKICGLLQFAVNLLRNVRFAAVCANRLRPYSRLQKCSDKSGAWRPQKKKSSLTNLKLTTYNKPPCLYYALVKCRRAWICLKLKYLAIRIRVKR
jgi:hypothetical protein